MEEEDIKEEKEYLEDHKLHIYSALKTSWARVSAVKEQLAKELSDYSYYREAYEEADRKLATIDGRLNKLSAKPKKESLANPFDGLSSDQILRIAEELEKRSVNGEEE